jgi:hypothetical protein
MSGDRPNTSFTSSLGFTHHAAANAVLVNDDV